MPKAQMTDYQTEFIYYVYKHIDPRNGELFYIGHGARGRAWIHGSKRSVLRSQEHLERLESLTQDGFVATDWVELECSGLSKKAACGLEQSLIRELKPTYNKPQGLHNLKAVPELVKGFRGLRESGLSYQKVAEATGVSSMTVYRAINGQTKNVN